MKMSKNDIQVVEQLVKENYGDWISEIGEILQQPESPLSLKNGKWTVVKRKEMWQSLGSYLFDEHLDRFKQIVVSVFKEPDPQFELPREERYMANIHGKVLKNSHGLRKGFAESLALLGSRPDALKNCSRGKAETIAICSIREIFRDSDWILWASLNELLPTLAEAAPEEFLNAVENALQKAPCPFDEILAQENTGVFGNNYMTGLLWALETLAWEEQYLVQVTVLLGKLALRDPGGKWGNRPDNSLINIFLPWYPQTISSIDKRKAAIQILQKEIPEVAWKLLLELLPNQHQSSSGTRKPIWRKVIPDDWKEGVTKKEYWQQTSFYADIVIEMAKGNFAKLNEIINNLDNLTKSSFDKLIEYLKSEEIKNSSEEERTILWMALEDFTLKHRRYNDEDGALGSELIENIKRAAQGLAPRKPQNLYIRLFSKSVFDLFEERGNWEEQEKKLEENRKNAIREIINYGGLNEVYQFVERVKFPEAVGFSLGFIAECNVDKSILPDLLKTENNKLALFASGFVWGRYCNLGWEWIEQSDAAKWPNTQIGKFLTYLPFTKKTWEYSKYFLKEHEDEYWNIVYIRPYQDIDNLSLAIDKLIQYDRPYTAIQCLYVILLKKKTVDKTQAVTALLKAVSSTESTSQMSGHEAIEIIKALQNDPDVNEDDLFRIEWAYLPLLFGHTKDASPKLLEHKIASEPDFFCEVIRSVYRSKNKTESNEETTGQQQTIAKNASNLLVGWKTPPGMLPDGSFSVDKFSGWMNSVKSKCKESGHIEVALITIGQVMIHSIPDPDGLWIHKAIAEAMNSEDADDMRHGFYIGILNSRGAHWVDPTGKPEKELASTYKKQAEEVENAGYYRFAVTLRDLAKNYERDAERIIEEHSKTN